MNFLDFILGINIGRNRNGKIDKFIMFIDLSHKSIITHKSIMIKMKTDDVLYIKKHFDKTLYKNIDNVLLNYEL